MSVRYFKTGEFRTHTQQTVIIYVREKYITVNLFIYWGKYFVIN